MLGGNFLNKKTTKKSVNLSRKKKVKMSQSRISREIRSITTNDINEITATPTNNIYEWTATIKGPKNTSYEGGDFSLSISFPIDYPLKPPKVIFKTKIYHPNVGSQGEICLDILKNKWNPSENIISVLKSIYFLLSTPDPEDSLNAEIAAQYRTDRENFEKTAKEWTLNFASST